MEDAAEDPEESKRLQLALTDAVSEGNCDEVTRLLESHANPNHRDDHGETPLFEAVMSSNTKLLVILLEAGADPSIRASDGTMPRDYTTDTGILQLLDGTQDEEPAPQLPAPALAAASPKVDTGSAEHGSKPAQGQELDDHGEIHGLPEGGRPGVSALAGGPLETVPEEFVDPVEVDEMLPLPAPKGRPDRPPGDDAHAYGEVVPAEPEAPRKGRIQQAWDLIDCEEYAEALPLLSEALRECERKPQVDLSLEVELLRGRAICCAGLHEFERLLLDARRLVNIGRAINRERFSSDSEIHVLLEAAYANRQAGNMGRLGHGSADVLAALPAKGSFADID